MRSEILETTGSICKKVIFDENDSTDLPWMLDIREMEVEGHMAHLEPPCMPLVSLGRSLVHHLNTSGLLDTYYPGSVKGTISYVCQLQMDLTHAGAHYDVKLELSYRLRNPNVRHVRGLTQLDMIQYLYERFTSGELTMASVEMRMKYLLVLQNVSCSINGLLISL